MIMAAAWNAILEELEKAERKFPTFPIDPIHAASIVVEEAGELAKAANEFTYEDDEFDEMGKEAAYTGAMALRFLLNMNRMCARPSPQEVRE